MTIALEATTARKAAGQAVNSLNYKSPPQCPDLVAEFMSGMHARKQQDNGMFARMQRSMA